MSIRLVSKSPLFERVPQGVERYGLNQNVVYSVIIFEFLFCKGSHGDYRRPRSSTVLFPFSNLAGSLETVHDRHLGVHQNRRALGKGTYLTGKMSCAHPLMNFLVELFDREWFAQIIVHSRRQAHFSVSGQGPGGDCNNWCVPILQKINFS